MYLQIEMAVENKQKTAIASHFALSEFNRMPFELKNTPVRSSVE